MLPKCWYYIDIIFNYSEVNLIAGVCVQMNVHQVQSLFLAVSVCHAAVAPTETQMYTQPVWNVHCHEPPSLMAHKGRATV